MNAISKVLVDIVDDLKCIELSDKGWNIVGTAILIAAGIFWSVCADYGDLFKILGCAGYLAAAALWINKSGWGKWLMENMFNTEDMVPFED